MYRSHQQYNQKGVVLVIGMLILIVLTLIGLTGMRMTTFEEKMSGNLKDKHIAFEAAEAAMMAAENDIETNVISTGNFDADGSDGLFDNTFVEIWKLVDWDQADSSNDNEPIIYSAFNNTYNVKQPPRYIIEYYGTVIDDVDKLNLDNYGGNTGAGETELFRITARGTGVNNNSEVLLQSSYGKRL